MQQEAHQPLSLSFALPFQEGKEFKSLYIELNQHDYVQPDQAQGWDIRISFDFAGLGEISCHVSLAGDRVGASFYCAHEDTRARVEQDLPKLRLQLARAGFETSELHSYTMAPDVPSQNTIPRPQNSLIDIEV